MNTKKISNLLFPEVRLTRDDLESRYPTREVIGKVTRIAPSPTGFVHLGNLYNAVIAERLAHQSNGLFYLRIEDTDSKREVPGAVETVINSMEHFGILFDEGAIVDGDTGFYAPYTQSKRIDIYHVYAKYLVDLGIAYPCFCTEEILTSQREKQVENKEDIGYYGSYATCRNLTYEEIEEKLNQGLPYVLRFRAPDNKNACINVEDAIRGVLTMPVVQNDFVLLKSDGIPTYHFAHVVDDHLMRTTHVVRGEEWIPSLPIHIQLFKALGWKTPTYCHTATLMKMDGTSKRKLSKRKDPELALTYYLEEGYLPEVLWHYLLTILNSNYEQWHQSNPDKSYKEFQFTIEKMSNSGALFDLDKLNDISKEVLSKKTATGIYDLLYAWCLQYNTDFASLLINNKDLAIKALNIGRSGSKVRKDLITWKQTCEFIEFYFAECFKQHDKFPQSTEKDVACILKQYIHTFDINDNKDTWFSKVKEIANDLNYAVNMKDFKKTPELYKGNIADVSAVIRIATTGYLNAPDIWEISQILKESETRRRIIDIQQRVGECYGA